jgi:hypothetical protein
VNRPRPTRRSARPKPPEEIPETAEKPPPKPPQPPEGPEQRIGPAMTEAEILELVNGSYN